jgi:hypothetical protein
MKTIKFKAAVGPFLTSFLKLRWYKIKQIGSHVFDDLQNWLVYIYIHNYDSSVNYYLIGFPKSNLTRRKFLLKAK